MLADPADFFVFYDTCQTLRSLGEICIIYSTVNKTEILSAPIIGGSDGGMAKKEKIIIKINPATSGGGWRRCSRGRAGAGRGGREGGLLVRDPLHVF